LFTILSISACLSITAGAATDDDDDDDDDDIVCGGWIVGHAMPPMSMLKAQMMNQDSRLKTLPW